MRRELKALGAAMDSAGLRCYHAARSNEGKDIAALVSGLGVDICTAMDILDKEDEAARTEAWKEYVRDESALAATQRRKAEDEAMGRVSLSAKIRRLMGMAP